MLTHEVVFFANDEQLDQLRYALVDRIHDLERLVSEGDSIDACLQSALDDTRQVAVALDVKIGSLLVP